MHRLRHPVWRHECREVDQAHNRDHVVLLMPPRLSSPSTKHPTGTLQSVGVGATLPSVAVFLPAPILPLCLVCRAAPVALAAPVPVPNADDVPLPKLYRIVELVTAG